MVVPLLEMVLAATMQIVLSLITNWWLILVPIVSNIALIVGICSCVDILTGVLVVIWIRVWVESLAVNVVEDVLLFCHKVLLLLNRKIRFDVIVTCGRLRHRYSFVILIFLLEADSLLFIVVLGIKIFKSSLI